MQGFMVAPPIPVSTLHDPGTCFCSSDDGGYEGENFPSGGPENHQSTLEWTATLVQEAEISTGLVLTKPSNTQNSHQVGVSAFLPRWKWCCVLMALTKGKQPNSIGFPGRLHPRRETGGEEAMPCPDPQGIGLFLGRRAVNPGERCVNSLRFGNKS